MHKRDTRVCICVCLYTYVYVYVRTCMCMCMCMCMCVYVHVHVYVCLRVYTSSLYTYKTARAESLRASLVYVKREGLSFEDARVACTISRDPLTKAGVPAFVEKMCGRVHRAEAANCIMVCQKMPHPSAF